MPGSMFKICGKHGYLLIYKSLANDHLLERSISGLIIVRVELSTLSDCIVC